MSFSMPSKHLGNRPTLLPKNAPLTHPDAPLSTPPQPDLPSQDFTRCPQPLLKGATAVTSFDSLVNSTLAADCPDLNFAGPKGDSLPDVGLPPLEAGSNLDALGRCIDNELRGGVSPHLLDQFIQYTQGTMVNLEDSQTISGASLDGFSPLASTVAASSPNAVIASEASSFFEEVVRTHGIESIDVAAIVQQVLRESYLIQSEQLLDFARKVKFYSKVKKAVRNELKCLRESLSSVAGDDEKTLLEEAITPSTFNTDYSGPESRVVLQPGSSTHQNSDVPGTTNARGTSAPVVHSVVKGTTNKYVFNRAYDGSTSYTKISEHKAEVQRRLIEWVGKRSPAQKAALAKYWEEHGLGIEVRLKEHDGWDNNYWSGTNAQMGLKGDKNLAQDPVLKSPHESIEDYLGDILEQFFMDFEGHVDGLEGDINIDRIATQVDFPDFEDLEVSPPQTNQAPYIVPDFMRSTSGSFSAMAPSTSSSRKLTNKAELETHITNLEEMLNTVGDDSQLANVDLQNALQKQQQVVQLMSTISKLIHDTAMAVIRKIS